jgi:5'-3' exonuclease
MAFRAFYATLHGRTIMSPSKGERINAMYVFATKLLKAWSDERHDSMAIAFDTDKSFRPGRDLVTSHLFWRAVHNPKFTEKI